MTPSRFLRTPAVLLAATLVASSSAIEFGSENDGTQTAGTVAPGGEALSSTSGSYDPSSLWTQTAPSAASSGNQDWTPTSGVSSGPGDQGYSLECSGSSDAQTSDTDYSLECSGSSDAQTPDTDYSLECSGSSDAQTSDTDYSIECSGSSEGFNSDNDFSLECSGSDESTPIVSTSTAGSSASVPTASTTSSGSGDQIWSQPSSTASPSNTVTETASGEYEDALLSTTSSYNAAPSSTTEQSTVSSSSAAQSTNSTGSGDHATFGTVTSTSGECVIGDPDTYVSTSDINWVWENRIGPDAPARDANWNVMDNKNWIMDHIVANKGSLNYCVRWDSTEKLTKTVASKFQAMLERQYAAWNRWLVGYDCWPYDEIKINVVGFAVKEAGLLDWADDSLGTITVGDLDSDGVPQCDQSCYRFFDNAPKAWSDTSSCKGEPFDISLWPKQGLEGGFGYDWGQEVNLENMLQTLDDEQLVIVAHEIGHGFGLPDFYETADQPNAQWPNCIMMAGSSMTVTDSDGWMLRRVLEHLKSRYNF